MNSCHRRGTTETIRAYDGQRIFNDVKITTFLKEPFLKEPSRRLRLEYFSDANEVGEGPGIHFTHGRSPMNFHRDLAYS